MMPRLGWMEKVYADVQGYILFWKCQWMDITKTLMNDFILNILIISHMQCRMDQGSVAPAVC